MNHWALAPTTCGLTSRLGTSLGCGNPSMVSKSTLLASGRATLTQLCSLRFPPKNVFPALASCQSGELVAMTMDTLCPEMTRRRCQNDQKTWWVGRTWQELRRRFQGATTKE